MYLVLVQLKVKSKRLKAFKTAILKNAAASVKNEKECHRFDVCQSETDPAEWVLYEVYTDRAAFEFHHRQPHFLEWNKKAKSFLVSKQLSAYLIQNP